MKSKKILTICLLVLGAAGFCFGMEQAADIYMATTPPTIDGNLTDACFSGAPTLTLDPLDMGRIPPYIGTVDGQADLMADFWVAWDNNNMYMAMQSTDDVHNNPYVNADNSWADDCIELWFSPSFPDVQADASVPLMGAYGWKFDIDLQGSTQTPITYSNNSLTISPRATLTAMQSSGIYYAQTMSGANVASELSISWNGPFMGGSVVPAADVVIAWVPGLADNDVNLNAGSDPDGGMRWTGDNPHSVTGNWGSMTLKGGGGQPHVLPAVAFAKNTAPVAKNLVGLYDIMGRKISENAQRTGMRM